jgi:hypothetical protein
MMPWKNGRKSYLRMTKSKAIKKLVEEFFAGVNAEDLDRRMATMDPEVRPDPLCPFPDS